MVRNPLIAVFSLVFCGCSTAGYLFQAGKGQFEILNRARPIEEAIEDEKTPPKIRRLLSRIEGIKQFGEQNALKKTKNYTDYVKLDRSSATWVVSAAETLRFRSKEWSFPIIGSIPYLGFFDLEGAGRFARELEHEGWDVNLRGSGAYSTLGWFRDPVLSTMMSRGDQALGNLANVILHESVHATYYLKGQSTFNESIASFVADRLTEEYLAKNAVSQGGDVSQEEIAAYRSEEQQYRKREARFVRAYADLNQIYLSSAPDAEKLEKKKAYLKTLQEELKLSKTPNNAMLIQFKTYNTGFDAFEELLKHCSQGSLTSNWPGFWGAMKTISEKDFPKKQADQAEDWKRIFLPLKSQPCR